MRGLLDFLPQYGPDSLDLTAEYNTRLTPEQERQFVQWAQESNRIGDLYDYDLRGAWLQGAASGDGHLPDTFKKPNHPTFSMESQYSAPGVAGGVWGEDTFTPSQQNLATHPRGLLADYFRQVEPDVRLLPFGSTHRKSR